MPSGINISQRVNMEYQEEDLINGCKKGENDAFRLLYKKYSSKMLVVCLRYTNSRPEAEDVLQEGFIKVFKSIHQFRNEGSFEGWLKRVMVNTALESFRKQKKMELVDYEFIPESESSSIFEGNALNNFEIKDLLKMIQELPKGCNVVFNLFAIEGYSHKEISDMLNISEGTSKSQVSRARSLLQKAILLKQ
jgi:RNA polymerase sigma factor (sigma-70 family)